MLRHTCSDLHIPKFYRFEMVHKERKLPLSLRVFMMISVVLYCVSPPSNVNMVCLKKIKKGAF